MRKVIGVLLVLVAVVAWAQQKTVHAPCDRYTPGYQAIDGGTGATFGPSEAQLVNQVWIRVCNSQEADAGYLKCLPGSTIPTLGNGSNGAVLLPGDCWKFYVQTQLSCSASAPGCGAVWDACADLP